MPSWPTKSTQHCVDRRCASECGHHACTSHLRWSDTNRMSWASRARGGNFLLSLGVFPCALGHRTSRMRGVWPSTRAADPSPCGPLLASALRPLTAQRFRIPHLLSNELGAWSLSAYCCYVHLSAPDWGCHSAATLRATTCNNVQHACNIRATYVQHPPASITFLHKVRMCCYKIENS